MNAVIPISTRKLPTGSIEATLGDLTVVVRQKDGYINATRLCKDGGKEFKNWYKADHAKSFLEELTTSAPNGTDPVDLVLTGDNDYRGTWVHPDVAVQIANWISPQFAVKVSQVVRRYYTGDLTLAGEVVKNHDEIQGTTSMVQISTVLGKRKLVLELDEREAKIRRMQADLLRECMEFLTPSEHASEVQRVRAESDIAVVRSHYIKVVTGGEKTREIEDGRGTEISFALLEQKMGVRLNKSQRLAAGRKLSQLIRDRRGSEYTIPKREEIIDGRVMMVNAYWSCDEDLMRIAIESVL